MTDKMPHSISEGKRMVAMLQKRNDELRAALRHSLGMFGLYADWIPGWMTNGCQAAIKYIEKVLSEE